MNCILSYFIIHPLTYIASFDRSLIDPTERCWSVKVDLLIWMHYCVHICTADWLKLFSFIVSGAPRRKALKCNDRLPILFIYLFFARPDWVALWAELNQDSVLCFLFFFFPFLFLQPASISCTQEPSLHFNLYRSSCVLRINSPPLILSTFTLLCLVCAAQRSTPLDSTLWSVNQDLVCVYGRPRLRGPHLFSSTSARSLSTSLPFPPKICEG